MYENLIEFVHLNPSDNVSQNINKWWTCYLDTGKQNNVPELSRVFCYQIKHDPIDSSEIDNSTRIYLFGKVREILRLSPPERVEHIGPCENKKYIT